MALSNSKVLNIYEDLKYNFLFNNDINSIHILLNLYDLESNINNIFPKYLSINNLRRNISRLLRKRKGNHLIASNLGQLIHEDINRLELYMYLEGYKHGFLNSKMVNSLEGVTIKYYQVSDLYNMKYLFHFDSTIAEVEKLKVRIFESLETDHDTYKNLEKIVNNYTSNIIKSKIFSLNKYLDKQLIIYYDSIMAHTKEEEAILTRDELMQIYNEVVKIIFKNGYKIYNDSYWYGINDRVLKRYN